MTQASPNHTDNQPFGTQPQRAAAPLMFWGIAYAAWFLFLIAMAVLQTAR